MSAVEAAVRLGIEMRGGYNHHEGDCVEFTDPLYLQLASGKYVVCATMPLPRSREAWEADHRTGRKRAWKAEAYGYHASLFERDKWGADIRAINRSADYRQGRPMDISYANPDTSALPSYPCELHAIRYYGVFDREGSLVAYMQMYRAGDLALVSQVLGHADHEPNGIMYLLFRHALEAEGAIALGVCVYNRWDSGTDGLRFLKARVGFEETAVEWLP